MSAKEAFFDFLSPQHLYSAAIFFGAATIFIVVMIYLYLYIKKRRFRTKARIVESLNNWVSEALTEDEIPEVKLPADLMRHFRKKVIRQFVIDSLIKIRQNVTGTASEGIIKLYEELGLRADSVAKMKSFQWYSKAKGIYELYMMNQTSVYEEIMEYTDSSNEYVRTEAQTATVGFAGFEGLVFLNTLTQPINEWQQLKILEQLEGRDIQQMPHLPQWLQSDNRYVVLFALRLADIYQQFQVHNLVVDCLTSEHDKIRAQAIRTLGRIAESDTLAVLKKHYPRETLANKLEILRQIAENGGEEDVPFLQTLLEESDDRLKTEAGKAIVAIHSDGWNILQSWSVANTAMVSIVKHIKYETSI